MAAVKIRYHSVSADLSRDITATISAEIQKGKKVNFLLPSARYIFQLKETLVAQVGSVMPGQLFFGNFLAWAKKILEAEHRFYRILGPGAEWILLFDFLRKNHALFKSLKPGALAQIQKIVTELQESGWTGAELNRLLQSGGDLAPYVDCVNYFLEIAREKYLASPAMALMLALENLLTTSHSLTGENLVIAGFYEFNPIQQKLVNHLIKRSEEAIIFYPEQTEHPVFQYIKPVAEILESKNYTESVLPVPPANTLSRIADNLYHNKTSGSPDDLQPGEFLNDWSETALILLRCPTRRQEVHAAVQTVKKWIAGGMQADRIAVVYRDASQYNRLIRLVFPAGGIPVENNSRLLAETVPLRIISKIFDVNERNFHRESLIDLTRFEAVRRYYGEELIQKFEYQSASWGMSFDRESWLRQLTQRREFLRTFIESDTEELKDIGVLRQEQMEIDSLLPLLKQLIDDISLPPESSWCEYIEMVQKLLRMYWFADPRNDSSAELIDSVRQVFMQLHSLVDRQERLSLRDFSMALNNLVQNTVVSEETPRQTSGITIADVMDVRGGHFDGIVLLGMADGEFPASRRENPLLNNRQRRALNQELGRELFQLSGSNIQEEKFLFYSLLHNAAERMLISFPQFDNAGRALAMSPFLDDLLMLANQPEWQAAIRYCSISPAEIIPDIRRTVSRSELLMNRWYFHWDKSALNFLTQNLSDANALHDIGRRIDIETQRRQNSPCRWNGCLTTNNHRRTCFAQPLSVTRLQQYAWCPFLYLCQYIWKIDAVDEPLAEVSALSDGLLIHGLLEAFLKLASPQNFDQWKQFITADLSGEIEEVLDHIKKKYRSAFAYLDKAVWNKKMADLRRGLRLFIQREIEALESECTPGEFEYRLKFEIPLAIDDCQLSVPLQLKIDRIDRSKDDGLVILEYKRSAKSVQDPRKGLDEGVYFQLPFYLYGYKELFTNTRFAGVYSYIFNEGKVRKGLFTQPLLTGWKTVDCHTIERLITDTAELVTTYLRRIFAGDFFLNPYDVKKRCQPGKCPYFEVCRIDTRQIEIMADEED